MQSAQNPRFGQSGRVKNDSGRSSEMRNYVEDVLASHKVQQRETVSYYIDIELIKTMKTIAFIEKKKISELVESIFKKYAIETFNKKLGSELAELINSD